MMPPAHQVLDRDEDDNIDNQQLDIVPEDDSDHSDDLLFDERDASSTEDDNGSTDADDEHPHEDDTLKDDTPYDENNSTDTRDKLFPDANMPDEDVPEEEQMPNQETTQASGQVDQPVEGVEQHTQESARYNLRPKRDRGYEFRLDHQMDDPENDKLYKSHQFLQNISETDNADSIQSHTLREAVENRSDSSSHPAIVKSVVGIILNQMSAKVGIKIHGKVAIDAIFDEFLQFHDLNVFDPRSASSLTRAQKRGALQAISVIKEKRRGKIKGRTVADGRVQKGLYGNEKTASPTITWQESSQCVTESSPSVQTCRLSVMRDVQRSVASRSRHNSTGTQYRYTPIRRAIKH
jgi:hypothetical protein